MHSSLNVYILRLFLIVMTLITMSNGEASAGFVVKNITTVTSRDGTTIHVEARGNRLGPHIIFAPGFATTLAFYDRLFDDPSMYTQVYMVRYDPRGYGLSGKPQDAAFYTSDRYADDVKAIIEGFKLKKPFFAGWSIGATIITDIAANFPHPLPFSGVISLAGPVYFALEDAAQVATPYAISLLAGLQNNEDTTLGLQARIDFMDALSAVPTVPFTTKSAWVGGATYMFPAVATLVSSRSQDETRLREEGKAGWPILALIAGKDRIAIGDYLRNTAETIFKNHEIHTLPNSGHIVFYDEEKLVAKHILSFVYRVVKTRPYP